MKFDEYFKLNEITINVSNGCNLACKYCFENNKSKQFMTQEQIKHILDKCYSNFTKNNPKNSKMLVSIFGGEPFLAWDTIEYALKYSREQKYNIEFGVTTNLTILTDHMIDIIEDYELGLLVSIDGLKEIHDKNRCNSYDLVTSNLKRLVERGLKYLIEVRMTVMPFGSDRLLESIQSIVDMGVVNIAPVPVSDTKWTQKDYDKLSKSISAFVLNSSATHLAEKYFSSVIFSELKELILLETSSFTENKLISTSPSSAADLFPLNSTELMDGLLKANS